LKREKAAAAPPPGRLFWPAWAAFAIVVLLIDLMNVQSLLRLSADDAGLKDWSPAVYEYSSGLVEIALFPAIWRLARLAFPHDGHPGRFWRLHAGASAAFCVAHVGGFILLRKAIFAAAGAHYHFDGWGGLLYEYPRDAITYGLAVGGLWGITALIDSRASAPVVPPAEMDRPTVFDIRDGARTLRVPLNDITAVTSAGNYVEFNLADCRKPLMRGTLGAMERRFAAHGFVRVHRSWLVNAARVEAIEPAGSGDFTITLAGGVKAPFSRRFRNAMDSLRR
jgi:hypothetical protein